MKRLILIYCISLVTSLIPAYADDANIEDNGIDDNQTFHVYDDLDLVSTLKLNYYKPRIVAKVVYPQLNSDTDTNIANFNTVSQQIIQDEIDHFQARVRDARDVQKLQKGIPRGQISNNVYIDYDTSYLKSNDDHVLSIRFTVQGVIPGLTRPYHYHRALNYNVDTDEQIELTDILDPHSDYLQALSEFTRKVLSKRIPDHQFLIDGTAPLPDNFAVWNLKPDGILLTFDEGKVAPVVYGSQSVLVPFRALTGYLLPDSEAGWCANHPKRCAMNSLLTGGFLD